MIQQNTIKSLTTKYFYAVDKLSRILKRNIITITTQRFTDNVIYNKKFSSVFVINNYMLYNQKRFVGGDKPVGHARKVLDAINKHEPKLNIIPPKMEPKTTSGLPKEVKEVPYDVLDLKKETSHKDINQTIKDSFMLRLKNSMNHIVNSSISSAKLENNNHDSQFLIDKNTSAKPPKFIVIEVSEDFRKADNEGSPLPSYELNHLLIMEVNSGIVFAQYTSSKNAPDNFKFSDIKLDGSPGKQYISMFKFNRRYTYNYEFNTCGYKINKVATNILNDNIDNYNFIKDRFNAFKDRDSVDRVHKNDSRFYEENGIRSEPESKSPLPIKNLKMEKLLKYLLNNTDTNDDFIENS